MLGAPTSAVTYLAAAKEAWPWEPARALGLALPQALPLFPSIMGKLFPPRGCCYSTCERGKSRPREVKGPTRALMTKNGVQNRNPSLPGYSAASTRALHIVGTQ